MPREGEFLKSDIYTPGFKEWIRKIMIEEIKELVVMSRYSVAFVSIIDTLLKDGAPMSIMAMKN